MVFKIGLLIVLLLIIVEIDEDINSIERLRETIIKINYQEDPKDDNKNTTAMQKQEKQWTNTL